MSNSLAPWRIPLSQALHRNRSQAHSRYFQLATVTSTGLPRNRTVVFRGFLDYSNQIKIITDLRSEKISHIHQQPWGEICWYFSKTREQFRLSGKLNLITVNDHNPDWQKELQITWKNLSDAARLQFIWPHPGQTRSNDQEFFSTSPLSEDIPVDNFSLLLLDPQQVDHLELRGNPQNRCLYRLDQVQNWIILPVNP